MSATVTPPVAGSGNPFHYTKDDFVSGADVRWCPGCGDYAILSVMQKTLADHTTTARENHVFISGIGCSSRLPYYMNTYGFHTIHGRAPAIATGLKCARPDLTVWIITGDGDGLSIGGNHLMHCMRRNVDVNMILVNNEIYGLTKGQYSPTSKLGKVAKSTPDGSIDYPINPLCIALAAEATYVARTVDCDPRHMGGVLVSAMKHKGASFVEIYQNCVIFNKDTHQPIVGREFRDDRAIYLEHDKPLIFGKNRDKGIKLNAMKLEIVDLAAHPEETQNVAVHDAYSSSPAWAYLLTQMAYPEMPVPFGVFRSVEKPSYEQMMHDQVQHVTDAKGPGNLEKLLYNEEVWKVTKKVASSTGEKKFIDATEPEKNYWHNEEMQRLVDNKPDGSVVVPKDRLSNKIMNERVADFISKVPPIIVSPKTPIGEVIQKMQSFPTKGCVLICDDSKKLVGIVSIRDILFKVAGRMTEPLNAPIESIMTRKVECLEKDAPLSFALNKMAIGKFRHVPVLDNGLPIGVVSTRDFIEYLSTERKK